jgi:hypothetical protein
MNPTDDVLHSRDSSFFPTVPTDLESMEIQTFDSMDWEKAVLFLSAISPTLVVASSDLPGARQRSTRFTELDPQNALQSEGPSRPEKMGDVNHGKVKNLDKGTTNQAETNGANGGVARKR